MTEEEWLVCDDAERMLEFVRGKTSERKLRLFVCACVAQLLPLAELLPTQTAEALAEVEEYADGKTTRAAMKRMRERMAAARATTPSHRTTADDFVCYAIEYASQPNSFLRAVPYSATLRGGWGRTISAPPHAALLRDIFGNPFRPLACDPAWLTSTVVALAEGIYADRAFDRMPILVDALQDAGCDAEDILAHCRDMQRTHVRGCWVIDLLTGRG